MNSIVFVTISLSLVSVLTAQSDIPACNSLKPVKFDLERSISFSPLTIYRSNLPIFECGLSVWLGRAGQNTNFTGAAIILIGNYTFTYNFHLIDDSLFKSVQCSNGIKRDFQTVYVNSLSASACLVSCNANDATKYDIIVCGGRQTSEDERDIDQFLSTTLKGVKGILHLQSGCPKPQHCDTFIN